jgi:hypothetical protein
MGITLNATLEHGRLWFSVYTQIRQPDSVMHRIAAGIIFVLLFKKKNNKFKIKCFYY